MKPAPVPLFNYRKRQRQAILSDPQQVSSNTSASDSSHLPPDNEGSGPQPNSSGRQGQNSKTSGQSSNYALNTSSNRNNNSCKSNNNTVATGGGQFLARSMKTATKPVLMNITGTFAGRGATTGTSVNNNRGRGNSVTHTAGSSNSFTVRGGYSRGGNQPLVNPSPGNSARGVDRNRRSANVKQQRNFESSSSASSSFVFPSSVEEDYNQLGNKSTVGNRQVSNRGNFSTECRGSQVAGRGGRGRGEGLMSERGRGRASGNQNTVPRAPSTSNSLAKSGIQIQQLRGNKRTQYLSSRGGQHSMNRQTQQHSMFNNGDDFDFGNDSTDGFADFSGRSKETSHMEKVPIPANSKTTDKSMRIFTCPIASLKSWTASRFDMGVVMFEVYGIIDSATIRDRTGTAKEFVLRDDTSSIKCIFYEIDRDLPRLIRGQVHRVIGLMEHRQERLKVISVRLAEKEERHVCQLASQVSQRAMEELARVYNEQ